MRWPWTKAPASSDEAKEHLQRIIDREPEVKSLSRKLKEAQRRNHFSDMVAAAISRVPKEGN